MIYCSMNGNTGSRVVVAFGMASIAIVVVDL